MSKTKKTNTPYDPDLEGVADEITPREEFSQLSHDELVEKLCETDAKAKDYWERVLRMQADAENASKRAERDVVNAHKYGLEKFVQELLPIVDSLELAATSVPEDMKDAAQSVVEGVDLTLKMLYTAFEKFGVQQVNPVGEQFDPEFQQAIKMEEDPEAKPNSVISVLQKGYTLNNRLVRPALVVVAKGN